jgi:fructose 1,6-bisphosphatase
MTDTKNTDKLVAAGTLAADYTIQLYDHLDDYKIVIRRPDSMCTLLQKVQTVILTPAEADELRRVLMDGLG